jgi:hypothetical protein
VQQSFFICFLYPGHPGSGCLWHSSSSRAQQESACPLIMQISFLSLVTAATCLILVSNAIPLADEVLASPHSLLWRRYTSQFPEIQALNLKELTLKRETSQRFETAFRKILQRLGVLTRFSIKYLGNCIGTEVRTYLTVNLRVIHQQRVAPANGLLSDRWSRVRHLDHATRPNCGGIC